MSNLLALDQSSRTSGYAIFKDQELIHYGHFTFDDADMGVRLNKIKKKIKSLYFYFKTIKNRKYC